jgi:hypothetical protein
MGDTGPNTRVVNGSTAVLIHHCMFSGISFAGNGGTIDNSAPLTLTNVVITDSHANGSSTQITATSPPGAGSVDVTVQTCRASGVNAFTFTTPPALPKAGKPARPTAQPWALLVLALLFGCPGLTMMALGRGPATGHT